MFNRREFLTSAAASSLVLSSGVALANAPTDQRLVIILQRGGQDGLQALPPFADPAYYRARPTIGIRPPGEEGGALNLNGTFGLHPEMTFLAELYAKGELIAVPAASTRYRERSHFDGQDLLENGSGRPDGARSGFLNRALAGLPDAENPAGLNIGLKAPLILFGDHPTQTFAPSNYPAPSDQFLDLLAETYEDDPALAAALAAAVEDDLELELSREQIGRINGRSDASLTASIVGPLLARPRGPRVTVIESQGWDTHNNISFRGKRLFRGLSDTFAALAEAMAPVWDKTLIISVSEFGRSLHQNGGNGTDHGTGGTMFLAGGAVRGGRVIGDWPGLRTRDLYQERDVYPANSVEGVLKAALIDHLGIAQGHVENVVFPGTSTITPFDGLFQS